MRYLPQFLTRWFDERDRKSQTSWARETPWRQGSVLPSERATKLGLVDKSSKQVAIVISHDCDLACEIEDEPNIEVIVGTSIPSCLPDKTHAKNIRILHIDLNGPGGRTALELAARSKMFVAKRQMVDFGPDGAYSIEGSELATLRTWLAARYKRAAIPDGLQALIKGVFEEVAKKRQRPRALRGIYIDFEPDLERLPTGEKYELWVAVVYSTSEEGAKAVAEEAAGEIESKFRKKYLNKGLWTEIDLRECVAKSDTEFTLYETINYKLFRLEYLSLRVGVSGEEGT